MTEQVFGLTVNEVMAYAAVANVALALVLAAITGYYAWHARSQANASREQVAASNRQADAAQKTLDLLLNQKEQQRRIDTATVGLQLGVALDLIDNWRDRIWSGSSGFPQLPDVVDILLPNFSGAIPSAYRIDGIVAGNMEAGLRLVAEAETNIRVLRGMNPGYTSWQRPRDKAKDNLDNAKFQFQEARTRLKELTEDKMEEERAAS